MADEEQGLIPPEPSIGLRPTVGSGGRRLVPVDPWSVSVAGVVSLLFALPLVLVGTPDVEGYALSVFSTVVFARNLLAGVDPWFCAAYGFGIPLPSSTWLIAFPPAIPAALIGVDALYATLWVVGEFCFALYLLALVGTLTKDRFSRLLLLLTGSLSFSNLGPTYVDDWPQHFLPWALLPACLWYVLRTVVAETPRERLRNAAAFALAAGILLGTAQQNQIVTFASGLLLLLGALAWSRLRGVACAAVAAAVAVTSAAPVLVPTIRGMFSGGVNPLASDIGLPKDDLSVSAYGIFLEPARALLRSAAEGVRGVGYERVPFFGLVVLVLAVVGAVRMIAGRPAGGLPRDVSRAIGLAFLGCGVLTLLPSRVLFGGPRMWMYRDWETVLAILCAASVLSGLGRYRKALRIALSLHFVQIVAVASPVVIGVFDEATPHRSAEDAATPRALFGYARNPRRLFSGLRGLGVDGSSRVLLARDLSLEVRGGMARAGVTAGTDFALEGIPIVNAWYRGGETPQLGLAEDPARYGSYETKLSWKTLRHLSPEGLDVLGITHVLKLAEDDEAEPWVEGLEYLGSIDLPDNDRVEVYRNEDAWSRAVLLDESVNEPLLRPGCPDQAVSCRDFDAMASGFHEDLVPVSRRAAEEIDLPPGHPPGNLFVSRVVGPATKATVDGESRRVEPFLGSFGLIRIEPGDRQVRLVSARRDRMALTLIEFVLMAGALAIAVHRRDIRRPPEDQR